MIDNTNFEFTKKNAQLSRATPKSPIAFFFKVYECWNVRVVYEWIYRHGIEDTDGRLIDSQQKNNLLR